MSKNRLNLGNIEELPLQEKLNIGNCLGHRVLRPLCTCCGGSMGIRKALNKPDNSKPKYKKKRIINLNKQLTE